MSDFRKVSMSRGPSGLNRESHGMLLLIVEKILSSDRARVMTGFLARLTLLEKLASHEGQSELLEISFGVR